MSAPVPMGVGKLITIRKGTDDKTKHKKTKQIMPCCCFTWHNVGVNAWFVTWLQGLLMGSLCLKSLANLLFNSLFSLTIRKISKFCITGNLRWESTMDSHRKVLVMRKCDASVGYGQTRWRLPLQMAVTDGSWADGVFLLTMIVVLPQQGKVLACRDVTQSFGYNMTIKVLTYLMPLTKEYPGKNTPYLSVSD